MAESLNQDSTPLETDDSLNIKDILLQCLSKWYWFVISLAICVGYTYWNLLKLPDVYTRVAKVQIKEYGNQPYYGGEFNMNLFSSGSSLLDELAYMKSPDVIREVVNRLHLEMNYSTKGRFHDNVLYGSTLPISAVIEGLAENDNVNFEIVSDDKGNLTLTNFVGPTVDEADKEKTVKAALGKTVETPLGKITLIPSDNYTPEEITINVARYGLKGTTACTPESSAWKSILRPIPLSTSLAPTSRPSAPRISSTWCSTYTTKNGLTTKTKSPSPPRNSSTSVWA